MADQPYRLFDPGDDYATMLSIVFHARNMVQVARCAAQFSLAEHLDKVSTADAVASAEGLSPAMAVRLMRACVAFGLAKMAGEDGFVATRLLTTLRKDDPAGFRDVALSQEGWAHWAAWGRLDKALKTNASQVEVALGMSMWDYYASPDASDEGGAFTRSMKVMCATTERPAADIIDTSSTRLAVDVGGADGSLLHALARRNEALRGVVLDLANVKRSAIEAAEAAGLSDRIAFVAGDFMKEVPTADLYLLRWILHDWPDETCVKILRTCRRAAEPHARLVLIEFVIDPTEPTPLSAGMDINMLVLFGAKERTLDEYASLLEQGGFRLERHSATTGPFSILEARAV